MHWVNSAGGPLLLLPEVYLPEWHGVTGGDSSATDYDRACGIEDYVGIIDVGNGCGVVLGDEPLQTTWMIVDEREGGILVRWCYAENEASVIQHVQKVPETIFQRSGLIYPSPCPRSLLFDSGIPGDRLKENDYLAILLAPGLYHIESGLYQPDDKTSMILHRLVPARQ